MSGAAGVDDVDALRRTVADACRVLAARGLADGVLGHVSARVGTACGAGGAGGAGARLLVRARGPREQGLRHTTADDIRLIDLDGRDAEPRARRARQLQQTRQTRWSLPNELPLHTEVLRSRPDAGAVVHVHPPALLVCGLAGLELRPIYGAFDIPGMRLAAGGVPVHPRPVLIRSRALAHEMLATMGDRPICLLRGHGVTVTGADVPEAVLRTVALETLAGVTLEMARLGVRPEPVSEADLAELPDLGTEFNVSAQWRSLLADAS